MHTEAGPTCLESVDVVFPGCGHPVAVPCHESAAVLSGLDTRCSHPVSVTLPVCGHTIQVGFSPVMIMEPLYLIRENTLVLSILFRSPIPPPCMAISLSHEM